MISKFWVCDPWVRWWLNQDKGVFLVQCRHFDFHFWALLCLLDVWFYKDDKTNSRVHPYIPLKQSSQIIIQFYRRILVSKSCNVIWQNRADILSGFPSASCPSTATATLPHGPHESFSSPGKVLPTKPLTLTDRSGTWELRGLFLCSDQSDKTSG